MAGLCTLLPTLRRLPRGRRRSARTGAFKKGGRPRCRLTCTVNRNGVCFNEPVVNQSADRIVFPGRRDSLVHGGNDELCNAETEFIVVTIRGIVLEMGAADRPESAAQASQNNCHRSRFCGLVVIFSNNEPRRPHSGAAAHAQISQEVGKSAARHDPRQAQGPSPACGARDGAGRMCGELAFVKELGWHVKHWSSSQRPPFRPGGHYPLCAWYPSSPRNRPLAKHALDSAVASERLAAVISESSVWSGCEGLIWLYFRFTLSFRDVEDLLAERGIAVSYETVRRWLNHFGPMIAAGLRKRRPSPAPPGILMKSI
jgi:hypothetical protein